MTTFRRLSWFNRIALTLILIGVIVCVLHGQWIQAGVFALALLGLAGAVVAASRGRGSDRMRVDAAQPFDERERHLTTSGFALVGQFAILAQTALVIWAVATQGSTVFEHSMRLVALGAVLGIGNARAAKRA